MDLRDRFAHIDNAQVFPPGATIFAEGSPGDVLYVVLEGEVELRVHGEMLEVVGPGEILGEMALIDSKPRSATAVARTECRMAVVDERRFLFMVSETPFFALHVMRVLAERLRRMDTKWKVADAVQPSR
jgi:CRP/FNR family transcriptional regulator, cyclic AMP receptor protein